MAEFGDFIKEFKNAPPKEKILIGAGAVAVVAIILYIHSKSGSQATPVTLPGPNQPGGGGGGGSNPSGVTTPTGTTTTGTPTTGTQPTSTPKSPTAPPAGNKPTPKPTYPVRPIKANPVKQPTTITRVASRGKLMPLGTANRQGLPGLPGRTRGNAGNQPIGSITGAGGGYPVIKTPTQSNPTGPVFQKTYPTYNPPTIRRY
jgi:hypothetical protein